MPIGAQLGFQPIPAQKHVDGFRNNVSCCHLQLQVVLSTAGTKGAQLFLCFFLIIEIPLHWMSSKNVSTWVKTSFFRAQKNSLENSCGNVLSKHGGLFNCFFFPVLVLCCILQIKNTSWWICIYIYNKTIFQQKYHLNHLNRIEYIYI